MKLKPCPFCGSEAKIFGKVIYDYSVVCQSNDLDCNARIPFCRNKEHAIESWNKRI